MELMSSLLLCALATLVPQALGKNSILLIHNTEVNEPVIVKKAPSMDKDLSIKSHSLSNKVSDLQSVFMDANCKGCLGCMERAIKSHKVHNQFSAIKAENFHNDLVNRERNIRDKRKSNDDAREKGDKKTKKSKSKNNKSVTIIKYNDNERIYALKIIESNTQVLSDKHNTNNTKTCRVYSVKKSFPCESPEADSILKESKRKINKKSTKKHKREKNVLMRKRQ